MQLAVYMGFEKIYCLGLDSTGFLSNVTQSKGYPHFYGGNDAGFLMIPAMKQAYFAAKEYTEDHRIIIYNATRGGELEIFDRVSFDDLWDEE